VTVLATTPALPDGGGYVAAAVLVVVALLLVYFAVMAVRLSRLEREVLSLHRLLDTRDATTGEEPDDA